LRVAVDDGPNEEEAGGDLHGSCEDGRADDTYVRLSGKVLANLIGLMHGFLPITECTISNSASV